MAILTIDQGTTGTTVLLVDHDGLIISKAYHEFTQYYPKPGWVEHDPDEIERLDKEQVEYDWTCK